MANASEASAASTITRFFMSFPPPESTTERVRWRGWSGSRPRASASATAVRWISTSSAMGSSSPTRTVAPVARDVVGHGRVGGAQDPDQAGGAGEADRSVAVFHRGVALGVGLGGLAELERRLVRDPDRPAVAQEDEVVEGGRVVGQRHRDRALGVRERRAPSSSPRWARSNASAVVAKRVCTTDALVGEARSTRWPAARPIGESGTAVIAVVSVASRACARSRARPRWSCRCG